VLSSGSAELPYTYRGKITGSLLLTFFSSFGVPKGQKIQIIPPQSYVNLPFYPEGPRKKSVHRRLAKPKSRFHVDSLPPFLFFGPSGRKASEPHPFGAKIKFSLLSP
jgi:hypothetical protein